MFFSLNCSNCILVITMSLSNVNRFELHKTFYFDNQIVGVLDFICSNIKINIINRKIYF